MIARVETRLARAGLMARMRAAVRRVAARQAVERLEREERAAAIPDEKLTGERRVDRLSRDV